jgi:hypothetical protein
VPRAPDEGGRESVKVLFVAGFGPIVPETATEASSRFYAETLGIAFERDGDYLHTGSLGGVKHFALWPLSDAARSCFDAPAWPSQHPIPQAWVEFEVDDVARATFELKSRGYQCLVANRTEPWGQTVSRLLGPESLLVGLTHTPWLRDAD